MSVSNLVMTSKWGGFSLSFGKLWLRRPKDGSTNVCAAIEVMPVSRYSSMDAPCRFHHP